MKSDETTRKVALDRYSHEHVRDRYDADLLIQGFQDGAEWQRSRPVSGPARIVQMPPQPETSRRYWEVWCPTCTTHEGVYDEGDARLGTLRDEHNWLHYRQPLTGPVSEPSEEAIYAAARAIHASIEGVRETLVKTLRWEAK